MQSLVTARDVHLVVHALKPLITGKMGSLKQV